MAWNIFPKPDEFALLGEAGVIYRESGKFREARDVFLGMQALSPKSEVPEILLGTVRFQEKQYEQAIAHYRKALALNPRCALAYAQIGEAYMASKDKANATMNCGKAIELDPRGDAGKFARNVLLLIEQIG